MSITPPSSPGFPIPILPPQIVSALIDSRTVQYFEVSVVPLLAYDYLLTFADEVAFMWGRGWNALSILFFLNRYLPIAVNIISLAQTFIIPDPSTLEATCKGLLAQAYLTIVCLNLADAILVIRTYAIWNNNKRVAASLFAALLGTFAVELFYQSRLLSDLTFIPSPSPSVFPGCFASAALDTAPERNGFVSLLVLETVVFAVTLFELLRQRQSYNTLSGKPSALFETLYRDGISFYSMILGMSLLVIIVLQVAPSEFGLILTPIHRVIHSVLAARLVLNIRRSAATNASITDQLDMVDIEGPMAFAPAPVENSTRSRRNWSSFGRSTISTMRRAVARGGDPGGSQTEQSTSGPSGSKIPQESQESVEGSHDISIRNA